MKRLRCVLAALAVLALPIAVPTHRLAAQELDTADLYLKVVKSTVYVVQPLKGGYSRGSGSLIDKDKRLVLTNFHVVDEAEWVYVQFPMFTRSGDIITKPKDYMDNIPAGKAIKGKVLYRDKSRDLAIVQLERVPAGTPAIPLAKKSVRIGETVCNIGSPGAVDQLFGITSGTVRAVGVETHLVGGGDPSSVFRITARMVTATNPTNPGDSGGPLINKKGHQIAVTQSGHAKAQQVNLFVDITEVRAFLNEKKITIKELSDEPGPAEIATKDKGVKTDSPGTATKTDTPPKGDNTAKTDTPPVKDPTPTVTAEQEEAAKTMLRRAKLFAEGEENRPTYEARLKDIIKKYPGTASAKEAEKLLKALR
jgi:S1-C subfamily serine protease